MSDSATSDYPFADVGPRSFGSAWLPALRACQYVPSKSTGAPEPSFWTDNSGSWA
jgi:hypothetical protein